MTIGVGLRCQDGVTICSDQQLTSSSGFKYHECKLKSTQGPKGSFILSYAGIPDAASMIFNRLRNELFEELEKASGTFLSEKVPKVLSRMLKDKHAKGLQLLIGIAEKHHPPYLFRTFGDTVGEIYDVEFIGVGDGSALRYLQNFFISEEAMTIDKAEVFGSYIVSVANRYEDQCGGGPDCVTLQTGGTITMGQNSVFPDQERKFLHCEKLVAERLRELLIAGGRE